MGPAPAFDGIIIGAGHHGLVLGTYLAKAGLRILLLERRLMYGGGLATVEATLPGFYHNSHSINHFHISETPWFRDLGLADKVAYVTPRYEFGQPHPDGSALVFSRDLEETLAERLMGELGAILDDEDMPIADYLVGSLDDKGYLSTSIEEAAYDLEVPEARVKSVLLQLQSQEPIGIGARNG